MTRCIGTYPTDENIDMEDRFFIVDKQALARLRVALILIFIIMFYYSFRGTIINMGYDNPLFMLIYPVIQSSLFNRLVAFALMLAKGLFYFDLMKQFQQRDSKAHLLCLCVIAMLSSVFVLGFFQSMRWVETGVIIPNILRLLNTVFLLLLSLVFISQYRGYMKLAGICLLASIIIAYVLSVGLFFLLQNNYPTTLGMVLNLMTTTCECLAYFFYFRSFKLA
ncbi:hypothetical protein HMPREF1870_01276 [Bacteroidales bacterium KA00344]|nr:hypothetical protein HMPREF1870_01276 [Bacteroidales bacterium KA00344]